MSALRVDPPSPLSGSEVSFDYMYCANDKCRQLVVRVHETSSLPRHAFANRDDATRTWLARPRGAGREIDPLVKDPYRTDYLEAAAILDASPRMSAVLSRSLLADLLQDFAGLDDFGLNARIDAFRNDAEHPSKLREGMHHAREIANFGAHTQRNDQAQIIPVTREDAEWMLGYIDRLFDYFIVGPAKDREVLNKWDKNISDAGRKQIEPLAVDESVDAS